MTIEAVRQVPMPSRVRALPRDKHGRPIPWFVADQPDGTRDFRVAGGDKRVDALRNELCWVCGQKLPKQFTFLIGPMCTINRITAEPPMHQQCADYSAQVCPFVIRPQMVRRTGGMPEGIVQPPGIHSDANPGGVVLWTTNGYKLIRPPMGSQSGVLIRLEPPTKVAWWVLGRLATRSEAAVLLGTGYNRLQEECRLDPHPASALEMLRRQLFAAERTLPRA